MTKCFMFILERARIPYITSHIFYHIKKGVSASNAKSATNYIL